MVDPGTAIIGSTAIWGSKELMLKILGPSADYLGDEIKNFVQKCNVNLNDIFLIALNKLGSRVESPGIVNLRTLIGVIEEGRYAEENILKEYYGGLLASSRSVDGKDDRSVFYLSTIKLLSRYQLVIHYLTYYRLLQLVKAKNLDLRSLAFRESTKLFIPERIFKNIFGASEQTFQYATHSISGLSALSLIFRNSNVTEHLNMGAIKEPGILTGPTVLGIELFLLSCGMGDVGIHQLNNVNLPAFILDTDINEVKMVNSSLK